VNCSRTPAGEKKKTMASRVKPVTRLGLLGPAQPCGLSWAQPKKKQKSKKDRKNKKNVYA
jgi:hypothetical protein